MRKIAEFDKRPCRAPTSDPEKGSPVVPLYLLENCCITIQPGSEKMLDADSKNCTPIGDTADAT
jgi:hypothetical protein